MISESQRQVLLEHEREIPAMAYSTALPSLVNLKTGQQYWKPSGEEENWF